MTVRTNRAPVADRPYLMTQVPGASRSWSALRFVDA